MEWLGRGICVYMCVGWGVGVCASICPRGGRGGDEGKKGRIEKKRRKEGKRRTEVFGYMI